VVISTIHNLRETSERGGPTWYKEVLYRLTDGLGDITTIICQTAFDRHVKVGAVPTKRLRMVPNFVDTDRFSANEERRIAARKALGAQDQFVWLAVGRLVAQKDYPNLLRAVQQLDHSNMRVLVAGGGDLADQLKTMSSQMGLNNVVEFLGTNEDIVDLYNVADGYVMSSEFEGLSVALLEATSMSLPCVVTNAGGNAEIIQDQVNGFVVPVCDSPALAAAMNKLMSMPVKERIEMGIKSNSLCVSRYHKTKVMEDVLDLYAELRTKSL